MNAPVFRRDVAHLLTPAVEAAVGQAMKRFAHAECVAVRRHLGKWSVATPKFKRKPGRKRILDICEDDVRTRINTGATYRDIAAAVGCHHTTIVRIAAEIGMARKTA